MFDFDSEKKLIHENEFVKVYETTTSNSLTKSCTRKMPNFYLAPLTGYRVYAVEEKDTGEWNWVLYNDKGEPIYVHSSMDTVDLHIMAMRRALTEHK